MAERRYSDEETAAIFKAAAELQAAESTPTGGVVAPVSGEGMTLAQLQQIGREVGIPSDLVERVASGLDRRGRTSVRRFLGLPIGVGRTVPLQRTLTDAEWERLVVDLRETFDARGRLRTEGAFRQWTNGNLQALIEPTATGDQLRLKTMKGDAYALITGGFATIAFDAFLFALRSVQNRAEDAGVVFIIGLLGLVMIGLGALRIPGWAKLRQKQMEDIAARLTEPTS
jgi:hypothetical protein